MALLELTDEQLKDIGISRHEAHREAYRALLGIGSSPQQGPIMALSPDFAGTVLEPDTTISTTWAALPCRVQAHRFRR